MPNIESGYPEDCRALRKEFDKMLEMPGVMEGVRSAEALLDNFVPYMERKYGSQKEDATKG